MLQYMIVLYCKQSTARLQYTCSLLFTELMGLPCTIATRPPLPADCPVINYVNEQELPGALQIYNTGLLFETGTRMVDTDCFTCNGYPALFASRLQGAYPFDLLSAVFYLVSRYEEYLPHHTDEYGRYPHTSSLAFKQQFLHLPLINIWVAHFIQTLLQQFPALPIKTPGFNFVPTYDIDIAYNYLHKSWLKTLGGLIMHPCKERWQVLRHKINDPYCSYQWMDALHQQYALQPVYFFLLAKHNGEYDKNISPSKKAMQDLVANHAQKYTTGIHPSWQSGEADSLLRQEIDTLQRLTGQPVTLSRQHYIRFNLPGGYRRLLQAGITADYSMGYGSINGFRASVASSFSWYDIENETSTPLRVHPFCWMDANAYYEEKLTAAGALQQMMDYYQVCKQYHGTLVTLWHNNFLGTSAPFAGWRQAYQQFIAQVRQ
jgi:peptidoglycan/xylan/chitin deacetylase (PgdA/CDA1 family)